MAMALTFYHQKTFRKRKKLLFVLQKDKNAKEQSGL
jgi:hypothetical protein